MTEGATLVALQDADLEIMRAAKQLDEMPEKRAIIDARRKIQEVTTLKAKADELLRRLRNESSRLEDEASALEQKIAAEQKRVMSGDITNAKELQHITREVDSLKRRREKLDMETLGVMERVEKAAEQVAKVEAALDKLQAQEGRLVAEFKDKGGHLQTRIEQLKRERAALAGKLSIELLARYEELRAAKGGVGAGRLDGSTCTACRMELPAQRVDEIMGGPDIALCPACRRLLVVRTGEPEE
jgi:hypothetical protein